MSTPTTTTDSNVNVNVPATVPATPTLAPAERVARGKGTILVQRFASSGPASVVKAELKAKNPGLSAKKLTRMVDEVLRGERDVREQLAIAWVQGQFQAGFVPSHGEESASASCLKMRLVNEAPAVPVPQVVAEKEKVISNLSALLKSLGATDEQLAAAAAGAM